MRSLSKIRDEKVGPNTWRAEVVGGFRERSGNPKIRQDSGVAGRIGIDPRELRIIGRFNLLGDGLRFEGFVLGSRPGTVQLTTASATALSKAATVTSAAEASRLLQK